MTSKDLARAGELLLGAEWKRPIARLLGPHHPQGARDSLDPRLPFRWASGERPIPAWVAPVLARLLAERAGVLAEQVEACRELAKELEKAP